MLLYVWHWKKKQSPAHIKIVNTWVFLILLQNENTCKKKKRQKGPACDSYNDRRNKLFIDKDLHLQQKLTTFLKIIFIKHTGMKGRLCYKECGAAGAKRDLAVCTPT